MPSWATAAWEGIVVRATEGRVLFLPPDQQTGVLVRIEEREVWRVVIPETQRDALLPG